LIENANQAIAGQKQRETFLEKLSERKNSGLKAFYQNANCILICPFKTLFFLRFSHKWVLYVEHPEIA
jgi:hypothetical protein